MGLRRFSKNNLDKNYAAALAAAREKSLMLQARAIVILKSAGGADPSIQGLLYLERLDDLLTMWVRDLAVPYPTADRDMSTNATDETYKNQG